MGKFTQAALLAAALAEDEEAVSAAAAPLTVKMRRHARKQVHKAAARLKARPRAAQLLVELVA